MDHRERLSQMEDGNGEDIHGFADDKKEIATHEMVQLNAGVHRIFFQCLCVQILMGIVVIGLVASNSFSYSPVGSHLLGYIGLGSYALLLFFMITCSRNSSSRMLLILVASFLFGCLISFTVSLNLKVIVANLQAGGRG